MQRNQRSPANENMRQKLKSLARQSRQINLITPNWLRGWQTFPFPPRRPNSQVCESPRKGESFIWHSRLGRGCLGNEMGMKLYKWFKQNISIKLLDARTNFIAVVFSTKVCNSQKEVVPLKVLSFSTLNFELISLKYLFAQCILILEWKLYFFSSTLFDF